MEKIIVKKIITYSAIFNKKPNQEELYILLCQIPTFSAIELISFLYFRKTQQLIDEQEHTLFFPLLFKLDKEFQQTLITYLQKINIKEYIFLDKKSLLILIDNLLANNNKGKDELTEEQFSKLIMAYLICCDQRVSYQNSNLSEIKNIDSAIKILLPEQLKVNEIEFPKDYRVEFIRFYMFVQFCLENEKYKKYLDTFLNEYRIKSWDAYLFFVFDLYLKMVTNNEGATNKIFDINPVEYEANYLKLMSIDTDNYIPSIDCKNIREKPILYLGDNQYVVMVVSFFIDKIFQSFIFDLARILEKHHLIKNYGSIKSEISYYFTEQYLFYNLMENCFNKRHSILLKGKDIKNKLQDGEPDYYIRNANRIFIFEFKDVMLDANTKYSGDIDKIKKEILELFEWSTIEKRTGNLKNKPVPKGITQLLNTIENKLSTILSEIDPLENMVHPIYIFPIIVYQDCSFDIEGVNYILNNRFQKALSIRQFPSNYIIKEVTMISLNTIIQLEDFFSSGKLRLGTIINEFIAYKNSCENNKMLPFNKYLMRKAQNKGYKNLKTIRFQSYIDNLVQNEKKKNRKQQ